MEMCENKTELAGSSALLQSSAYYDTYSKANLLGSFLRT